MPVSIDAVETGSEHEVGDRRGGRAGNSTLDVLDRVREQILDGTLRPGTPISQVRLAAELGVSRTPLREALRHLESEGLVQSEHNRRVRVAPVDPDEVESVYAARIMLESLAIFVSVGQMSSADHVRLGEAFDEMDRSTGEYASWAQTHSRFHELLFQHAPPHLRDLLRGYRQRTDRHRKVLLYEIADSHSWQASRRQHKALLDACVAGDSAQARSQSRFDSGALGAGTGRSGSVRCVCPEHAAVVCQRRCGVAVCAQDPAEQDDVVAAFDELLDSAGYESDGIRKSGNAVIFGPAHVVELRRTTLACEVEGKV